jgi:hypothetical protein
MSTRVHGNKEVRRPVRGARALHPTTSVAAGPTLVGWHKPHSTGR